jgi:HD superfamily phosphohydrolase
VEVRDPLHGAIELASGEVAVVDHPFVQRLRGIRQMGFAELPFPGAVHTRYAHSIGAMELAGRAFDACFRQDPFSSPSRRDELRRCVRLAALGHDLGHAPFSHCTEFAMPPLPGMGIAAYASSPDRRATHEDYTIAILTMSGLARTISENFPFTGHHVAALVGRDVTAPDDFFRDGGRDYRRVLSQLISSELDVDRLDYLVRDSYYSGVRYGQVDVNWILSNLESSTEPDGTVSLALDGRGIYAFDDFMIARYHMFVQVYFHHKSVVFEEMLKRHFAGGACTWSFPTDVEAYLALDDVAMHAYLRAADDDWARRIVQRRPFKRALERHGSAEEVDLSALADRLRGAGIEVLTAGSTGQLSRYAAMGHKRTLAPPIRVIHREPGIREWVAPLHEATRVFDRYQDERHISRLYVPEDQVDLAQALLR